MEMRGVFYTADAVKHHPLLALTILKLHFQLYFNDIGLPAELDAVISILKTSYADQAPDCRLYRQCCVFRFGVSFACQGFFRYQQVIND